MIKELESSSAEPGKILSFLEAGGLAENFGRVNQLKKQ
jgi:hypothetical protein